VVKKILANKKVWGLFLAVFLSITIFIFRNEFVYLKGYGLFGLFILSILGNATIILPVPVVLTAFVGGAIFNPLLTGLVVSFGATIGELTGYLAGVGGGELIIKDQKFNRVYKFMEKHGLWALFVLAAIPNPFFDLAGMVAGATKVPVFKYFVAVLLGKIVKFVTISYLGFASAEIIDNI
jgi:uncharacterized membrane protein YdjX (TVP38/TMEM64 family)